MNLKASKLKQRLYYTRVKIIILKKINSFEIKNPITKNLPSKKIILDISNRLKRLRRKRISKSTLNFFVENRYLIFILNKLNTNSRNVEIFSQC